MSNLVSHYFGEDIASAKRFFELAEKRMLEKEKKALLKLKPEDLMKIWKEEYIKCVLYVSAVKSKYGSIVSEDINDTDINICSSEIERYFPEYGEAIYDAFENEDIDICEEFSITVEHNHIITLIIENEIFDFDDSLRSYDVNEDFKFFAEILYKFYEKNKIEIDSYAISNDEDLMEAIDDYT